ncbi:hypothetical protein HNP46_005779 [Pseudomonas nitritireducens]|uniref:Uncharacterized protein n=1 Tax=Pseudomonas nitroreducens TaxID=46680 RepID=A0A7W7P533_PSENT|nr:hypothetical protein [Pseudomonas nitritireducens]MBB4866872.1 hypothetical protein [Pseudomonas nitritireducens]
MTEVPKVLADVNVERDSSKRLLHIIPAMKVPASVQAMIKHGDVSLSISSSLGQNVLPEGGVVLRRPYPNPIFIVAGSNNSRNGWVVELPDGLDFLELSFIWSFSNPRFIHKLMQQAAYLKPEYLPAGDRWVVEHDITICLKPGTGNTFTFDSAFWSGQKPVAAPIYTKPVGHLFFEQEGSKGLSFRTASGRALLGEREQIIGYDIDEYVVIHGVPLEKAMLTINAHQEEQLHELTHAEGFSTNTEEHRANGAHEMPASVLWRAVMEARRIPFDFNSLLRTEHPGAGWAEHHPALKTITDWWKSAERPGTRLEPGMAMLWVRVEDNDKYHCGNPELPGTSIAGFLQDRCSQATVGQHLLVRFNCGVKDFTFDEGCFTTKLLNGSEETEVGIGRDEYRAGEYDEATFSLAALAGLPERYPEAWRQLVQMKESESPGVPDISLEEIVRAEIGGSANKGRQGEPV